jgi:hypothetical protein
MAELDWFQQNILDGESEPRAYPTGDYFGDRFVIRLSNERLTASFQSPLILRRWGSGPRVTFAFVGCFVSLIDSLKRYNGRAVHHALAFGTADR